MHGSCLIELLAAASVDSSYYTVSFGSVFELLDRLDMPDALGVLRDGAVAGELAGGYHVIQALARKGFGVGRVVNGAELGIDIAVQIVKAEIVIGLAPIAGQKRIVNFSEHAYAVAVARYAAVHKAVHRAAHDMAFVVDCAGVIVRAETRKLIDLCAEM